MAADDETATASPITEDVSPKGSPRTAPATVTQEEKGDDEKRVEEREALEYWGYMVKPDKCGSDKLNQLLAGIAQYISTHFEGTKDCADLTPAQLAAFYRAVGGNYDVLFVETQCSSLAFIYKALGCVHSMQPADETDGHATPTIPALKPRGFVTWQTIQLLLGPDEHVPFLQSAVEQFDIINPDSGEKFPKVLPKDAFPDQPNQDMLDWYDQVHEKLRQDVQQPDMGRRSLSLSDASTTDQSGDEKVTAANYFQNPMFRDNSGRPTVVRGSPRMAQTARTPRQIFQDRGRQVMHSVRHFISPSASRDQDPPPSRRGRRSSFPERYRDDEEQSNEYEDVTPTGLYPQFKPKPVRPRQRSPELIETDSDSDSVHVHKRPPEGRRTSSTNSNSKSRSYEPRERERREREWERDSPKQSPKVPSPQIRYRKSHEPIVSPRDYFHPPHVYEDEGPRRHSHATHGAYNNNVSPAEGGSASFAPSTEPSFASRVAKMQHNRTSSPRRVNFDDRGSSGSAGGYPRPSASADERANAYHPRPAAARYQPRRSIDPIDENRPRFERKKRSDDYAMDDRGSPDQRDYDPGYKKRSHSYERDAERVRNSMRYVEGAHGRRYPAEAPWQQR